jgi:hypothetical protein
VLCPSALGICYQICSSHLADWYHVWDFVHAILLMFQTLRSIWDFAPQVFGVWYALGIRCFIDDSLLTIMCHHWCLQCSRHQVCCWPCFHCALLLVLRQASAPSIQTQLQKSIQNTFDYHSQLTNLFCDLDAPPLQYFRCTSGTKSSRVFLLQIL